MRHNVPDDVLNDSCCLAAVLLVPLVAIRLLTVVVGRWLTGRLYDHPGLPRRWVWLTVMAACQTATSWITGRTW
jgi:hypothetical protein